MSYDTKRSQASNCLRCLVFGSFGPLRRTETLSRGRRPKRRLLAVEGLFDDAVDLDDGPWSGDGLRLGLAGLVDDDGGALVEDAARGCIVSSVHAGSQFQASMRQEWSP